MVDNGAVRYRVATMEDHGIVVEMLSELVDELGPGEMAEKVKAMLDEDIRIALNADHIRVFLAEIEEHTAGLSRGDILTQDPIFRLREDHRCGYIDQMFVRPKFRDSGVGAELLALCERWFKDQGVGHCILHAAPKAVRFYSRVGYQPNREMFKRL